MQKDRSCESGSPACHQLCLTVLAKTHHPVLTKGGMLYCAAQLSPDLAGLAWIQYMRWARRADSVNASRKLFVKARKWPQCSWQVRSMHFMSSLALSADKDCWGQHLHACLGKQV